MRLKLIKSSDGLRLGNMIMVDSFSSPPNFNVPQTVALGEGFEGHFNENTRNCAYLNADERTVKELLPDESQGVYSRGGFSATLICAEDFNNFNRWRVCFKNNTAEVSFIHELQNIFKDWTGNDLT